jgi:DNA-directed RNA polymerase subunit RPC12/RpoP
MAFEVVARTAPRDADAMQAWRTVLISEIRTWAASHGGEPPREMDWSRAHAARHGVRFELGWPTRAMINHAFGSWDAAIKAAGFTPRGRGRPVPPGRPDHCVDCGRSFTEWPRTGDRCRRCASYLLRNGTPRPEWPRRASAPDAR